MEKMNAALPLLTNIKNVAEDASSVEGGTIPPSVLKLMLALLNAHRRSVADHVNQRLVQRTQLPLAGTEERKIRAGKELSVPAPPHSCRLPPGAATRAVV